MSQNKQELEKFLEGLKKEASDSKNQGDQLNTDYYSITSMAWLLHKIASAEKSEPDLNLLLTHVLETAHAMNIGETPKWLKND